jgi:hypothetical protein
VNIEIADQPGERVQEEEVKEEDDIETVLAREAEPADLSAQE